MNNIDIRLGTVQGFRESYMGLLDEHWDEVARNKELMKLKPNWDKYSAMEVANKLLVIEARKHSRLVGYSVNILDQHLHYADLTVCYNDLLFVKAELRTTSTGLRLMEATRRMAKAHGAQLLLWHAKEGTALERILEARKSAQLQEIVFSEAL